MYFHQVESVKFICDSTVTDRNEFSNHRRGSVRVNSDDAHEAKLLVTKLRDFACAYCFHATMGTKTRRRIWLIKIARTAPAERKLDAALEAWSSTR